MSTHCFSKLWMWRVMMMLLHLSCANAFDSKGHSNYSSLRPLGQHSSVMCTQLILHMCFEHFDAVHAPFGLNCRTW